MNDILGRVVAVSGSQMRAAVTTDQVAEDSIRVGKNTPDSGAAGAYPCGLIK